MKWRKYLSSFNKVILSRWKLDKDNTKENYTQVYV